MATDWTPAGERRWTSPAASDAPQADPERVAAMRHFNRFYTRRIGVLQEGLLDSPFSLAEVRILYELAHRDGLTASDLAADLALDAGYLSRILQRLSRSGLVTRTRLAADARVRPLALTPKGRAAFAPLDQRSQQQVSALLGALPDRGAGSADRRDEHDRNAARRPAAGARRPAYCARTGRATWDGWSSGTARCTRRSTAGTSASRRWWPKSWRSSSASSIRNASAAGSPSATASALGSRLSRAQVGDGRASCGC